MYKIAFSFLLLLSHTHSRASAPEVAITEMDRLFGVLTESVLSRMDHSNFDDTQVQYRRRAAELRQRATALCRQARTEGCLEALRVDERLSSSDCFLKRWEGRASGPDRRRGRFSLSFERHSLDWSQSRGNCNALLRRDTSNFGRARTVPAEAAALPVPPIPPSQVSPPPAEPTAQTPNTQLRTIKPETCKWVTDLPRRIINAPGCTAGARNRICTGFVSCDRSEGEGKFIRLSTCRSEFCGSGDENAVRCTQDMNFSSSRPSDETRDTVSPQLGERLSGRGSRQ